RTIRPPSSMFASTRRPFRALSCADSPVATISSITTCQKLPPIFGALELCVCPRSDRFLRWVAGERRNRNPCHGQDASTTPLGPKGQDGFDASTAAYVQRIGVADRPHHGAKRCLAEG